jgi:hypothetical protein
MIGTTIETSIRYREPVGIFPRTLLTNADKHEKPRNPKPGKRQAHMVFVISCFGFRVLVERL